MMSRPMSFPRRILLPLGVCALAFAAWSGGGALCSCGGPERPRETSAPGASEPRVDEVAPPAAPTPEPAEDAPAALPDFSDPSWTRTPSAEGKYLVVWRPEPAPLPRNEDFALEVWILIDGQPQHVTQLGVSAWMPDHGHGMLRTVKAEPRPDGSYRVEHMLLHMRGQWLVVFDVLEGTLSERAEHALEL